MIQQYEVKISDLTLTDTGADGGVNYLVDVDINDLLSTFRVNVPIDMYGNIFPIPTDTGLKGKRVLISLPGMTFEHFSTLQGYKQTQDEGSLNIRLTLTHPYNNDFDYDLSVWFLSLKYKGMLTTTFRNVELEFITQGVYD